MSPVENKLRISLPTIWEEVNRVKREVATTLVEQSQDVRDATVMAASELAENAIKYAEPCETLSVNDLSLTVDGSSIHLLVRNGLKSKQAIDDVLQHIEVITRCEDPKQLYVERLLQLMKGTGPPGSKLGLYRIRYEGKFHLTANWKDGVLTVGATRKLA